MKSLQVGYAPYALSRVLYVSSLGKIILWFIENWIIGRFHTRDLSISDEFPVLAWKRDGYNFGRVTRLILPVYFSVALDGFLRQVSRLWRITRLRNKENGHCLRYRLVHFFVSPNDSSYRSNIFLVKSLAFLFYFILVHFIFNLTLTDVYFEIR